jgi:hypothetical protein
MAKEAAKIAVSIDRQLLRRTERLRKRTGESRSAVVSRALRRLFSLEERHRRVLEYLEAYRRQPEHPADVERARVVARKSLSSLPWEDE